MRLCLCVWVWVCGLEGGRGGVDGPATAGYSFTDTASRAYPIYTIGGEGGSEKGGNPSGQHAVKVCVCGVGRHGRCVPPYLVLTNGDGEKGWGAPPYQPPPHSSLSHPPLS